MMTGYLAQLTADYFGLHLDQNEKLVMYGVTHVVSIDGHSRFITAHSTMPIKNNEVIYEEITGLFRILYLFSLPNF